MIKKKNTVIIMLNPTRIYGEWTEGFVLDKHTESSVFIGYDEWDNPQFDTTHTELGELIYRMKYNGHENTSLAIMDLCDDFLSEWLKKINVNVVLPVPPSYQRSQQPAFVLARAISNQYGIKYYDDVLVKTSSEPSKNMDRSNKVVNIKLNRQAKKECSLLLVDDLFDTGTTANACVKALRTDSKVKEVFFLAFTRRRT